MLTLNNITNAPRQTFSIEFLDGQITFYLKYSKLTSCWLMDVGYKTFQKNGIRICNSINLLNSSRFTANFNIMCKIIDLSEPLGINDFINGRCELIILTLDEYNLLVKDLFNQ